MNILGDKNSLPIVLRIVGGVNPYVYAYDNPLRFTDPDGLNPIAIGACLLDPACVVAVSAGTIALGNAITGTVSAFGKMCNEQGDEPAVPVEPTPDTTPGDFEPMKGSPAKKHKDTGEFWAKA